MKNIEEINILLNWLIEEKAENKELKKDRDNLNHLLNDIGRITYNGDLTNMEKIDEIKRTFDKIFEELPNAQ